MGIKIKDIDRKIILTFAECDMNTLAASEKLFLHRNTVEYHFEKVKRLTGIDPKTFYGLVRLVDMFQEGGIRSVLAGDLVGKTVYCISQPCGGCEVFNEPMCEEFIDRCINCKRTEIVECKFDMSLYDELGTSAFPTREEAEAAMGKIVGKE